ncbi:MAG: substrate-binding domain-containing protein [Elusimicrobia bacterium]|nr:substrate-binding domain-containing protein [Candidatus Liberimonas magnetica]
MRPRKKIIILTRPEAHFIESFYFQKIKYGIDTALENTDYEVMMYQQTSNFLDNLDKNDIKNVGVINISPHVNCPSIQTLITKKIPSILVNCRSDSLSWVDSNSKHGVKVVTEHLISLGHKKIFFINGFLESQNAIDRLESFKEVLSLHNIKFNPELVMNCDFSISLTYERVKNLLSKNIKPDFSAIFASNDLMAVGAIRALADMGISVPHGMAVVGFDDFDFSATYHIPLTTYRQPFHNFSFLATKFLLKNYESKANTLYQFELIGELIIRNSCGAKIE